MTHPLKFLFESLQQLKSEQDLQTNFAAKIGDYFEAKRRGILFFDQLPLANKKLQKAIETGLSVNKNPVLRYLTERHTPVHEALVTSPKVWTMICPRPDHWHVMAGPIVSNNQLVGVIGCTREQSMPAFDEQNLADLSAICLHVSVWVAARRSPQKPLCTERLTSRELQIAELVALGKTNAEIGTELWITENSVKQALKRIFRKLEVSSRAAMVRQIYATQ
ncbi:transcriptional regulator, LuxR family [[Leptolyngbya] sp. PCC 7376]|uniref:LuxR C-terminal-related transcriptional regulator n=1 Tax=[Leptolyngbya] sp. PCC 7376 TaxID=111781 RepID=UPI00029F351F|nr:LuxR C-terminal-related transcriptional regulator [[Leptolyngbya] sp. PCC 7376]AFY40111.1 transcriptional regulator, LuxR family [[Leptolyngbya] sp. PCC 7376]